MILDRGAVFVLPEKRGGGGAMDASRLFGGWLCAPVFACVGCVFLLYFVVRGNAK